MSVAVPAILLVEDSDDDAALAAIAFKKARITTPLVRARHGEEALDYRFARGAHAARSIDDLPAVMLLDLNMPVLDGLAVLKAVRAHARIGHLPIVILTSSNEDRDRLAAYDHHCNSYVRKPVDFDQFLDAARQLGLYWLVLNKPAPPRPP